SAVTMPTRKTRVTRSFHRSHPMSVTKMVARFARSVELATDVHTIDQCQTPRSAAKKKPAAMMGSHEAEPSRRPFPKPEGERCWKAHAHKIGAASAVRQKALATGPVSESRTKIGAKAIAQPPARRHRKATVACDEGAG